MMSVIALLSVVDESPNAGGEAVAAWLMYLQNVPGIFLDRHFLQLHVGVTGRGRAGEWMDN